VTARPAARFGAIDRFVVPLDARGAVRYFNHALRVPHTLAQRVLANIPGTPIPFRPTDDDAAELLRSMLGGEVAGVPLGDLRWIVLRDYERGTRGRLIAFFFRRDAAMPFAIAKARGAESGGESLRREARALEEVRPRLSPEMQRTLPNLLRFQADERGELLVLDVLPGRSAYVETQRSLLPSRHLHRHFTAAGQWLAEFHNSTRNGMTTASHRDFWARNLLFDGARLGVIDWEHYTPTASPLLDLFHFPTTYGQNYPWRRYRRARPAEAFARTFVRDNAVSRAVRRYLDAYAKATGLQLKKAFDEYVDARGYDVQGTRHLPWDELEAAVRSRS
jgi:predicted RNA-binding protein YlxR (DUF448 family)